MAQEIHEREGVWITTNGSDSSYRPYDRQVFWRNEWCGRGVCGNAAVPGNSNHGWGIATDVPEWVRQLIVKYGAKYGWDRGCSDAPWESWHHKWCGGWSGKDPGAKPGPSYPTLKRGSSGDDVRRAQRHLRRHNKGLIRPTADGDFGRTTEQAVREFQVTHDVKPADGIIGEKTWKALKRKDPLFGGERQRVNKLRLLKHGKLRPHERDEARKLVEWLARRAHAIRNVAKQDGWGKEHRRRRHAVLKHAAPRAYEQHGKGTK